MFFPCPTEITRGQYSINIIITPSINHLSQGDSIYFLWSKKNLRVKCCLEHRLFLASTVVSARYRVGTKGRETRHGGLKIKVNAPSDPAENRRRPTFLKEEGKKIKTSSAQGLCSLAAGLVFGSLARGLRPQAGGGVVTSINGTGRLSLLICEEKPKSEANSKSKTSPIQALLDVFTRL